MASSIAGLITLLAENERAMEGMLLTLTEEQSCIVGMDIQRLRENDVKKEQDISVLVRLREECNALISRTAAELGCQDVRSLSALIEVVPEPHKSELIPVQRRQIRLAATLDRQFGLNRMMLMNSIGMIENSMTQFSRLMGGCDTYGVQGRINKGSTTGTVLCRAM